MYKHFFKRIFDFCIALVALLLIGWLLIIIAIWLHFANKGAGSLTPNPSPKGEGPASGGERSWLRRFFDSVFFLQERPGKDGKIFKVIKFKTMTDERDSEGNLLSDAQRLTKVGQVVCYTYLS